MFGGCKTIFQKISFYDDFFVNVRFSAISLWTSIRGVKFVIWCFCNFSRWQQLQFRYKNKFFFALMDSTRLHWKFRKFPLISHICWCKYNSLSTQTHIIAMQPYEVECHNNSIHYCRIPYGCVVLPIIINCNMDL